MNPAADKDFFISYTGVNQRWAEWIAVELEANGYTTVSQAFDFKPGNDFVHEMQVAATTAKRTIAVLSQAYFQSAMSEAEWRVAFGNDPSGELRLLVPIRVQAFLNAGLLATRVYVDLVDVDEVTARRLLLDAVNDNRARPTAAPFPGSTANPPVDATRPRFPGSSPEVTNLPARSVNFTGRDKLLEQIHDDLTMGSVAAVVPMQAVHGLGGIGKTQLALEYAHRFRSDYDITWWIPAEQPTAVVAALAGLARRLGVPELNNRAEMLSAFFDVLRNRGRWLLVFDNAERPDQLTGLLPPGGRGHVLLTSRWSTWSQHAVPLRLDVLSREESISLLRRRTAAGTDDLDVLADFLGDLPLALEEAAAYLEETQESVRVYLELVRNRFRDLFDLDAPTQDERDRRRVATVWSVSLDRVRQEAPAAEALLNLCAFFAPDIPRDLPAEYPDALPQELASVVKDRLAFNAVLKVIGRYSLVTLGSTTIGLHRLVQAVIQARLGRDKEQEWAEAAVTALDSLFPADSWEVDTWPRCEQLLPSVLVSTGHAERLQVGNAGAVSLLERAATYLRGRAQYRQARTVLKRALDIGESAFGPASLEVCALRNELGLVLLDLGEAGAARAEFDQILETFLAAGQDPDSVATARCNLGLALHELGDLPAARAQFELSLQIATATEEPDHFDVGNLHNNLGMVLRDLGDLAAARAELERAVEIGQAIAPDHRTVGHWHGNLGLVLRDLGELTAARVHFEGALHLVKSALGPDHPTIGVWRGNLGLLLRELGDLTAARAELERAVEIGEAAPAPTRPSVSTLHGNLGLVLRDLGDLTAAHAELERAMELEVQAPNPDHLAAATWRDHQEDVHIRLRKES